MSACRGHPPSASRNIFRCWSSPTNYERPVKNIVAVLKVEDLLKELHKLKVEFVIIGGMAAVAHGSAYLTLDLDLCYSRKKKT
jgi:hypothetical protein